MDDKKLFNELIKQGALDKDIAERILKGARVSGKSAEEILYEERAADEEIVAKLKSELLGVPYMPVDPTAIPDEIITLVPYETSRTYQVVPIEKKDNMLVVGMLDPQNTQAQNALKFIA